MAEDWVSAREVLSAASGFYDEEWQAVRALVRRAANGALTARALVLTEDRWDDSLPFGENGDIARSRNCALTRQFWQTYLEALTDFHSTVHEDWLIGDFTIRRVYRRKNNIDLNYVEYAASGVEFSREEVPFELRAAMPMSSLLGIEGAGDDGNAALEGDSKRPGGKHTPAWSVAATVALKLADDSSAVIDRTTHASVGAMIAAEYAAMGLPEPNPKNLERWGGDVLKAVLAARNIAGPRLAVSQDTSAVSQVSRDSRSA